MVYYAMLGGPELTDLELVAANTLIIIIVGPNIWTITVGSIISNYLDANSGCQPEDFEMSVSLQKCKKAEQEYVYFELCAFTLHSNKSSI